MISPELRRKLLVEFNGSRVPYPKDRTLLHLIEGQASQTPGRPALTFDGVTLTYGQLNQKANALAARLQRDGLRKGDITPLVMNNCLELPLSMLALMKLGAPFVPIDETWPRERIHAIAADMRPKLLLCSAPWESVAGVPVPTLIVEQGALELRESNEFGTALTVDDLIYGFYTSGSTGMPKCTLNVHLGLLNRFLYMTRRFQSRGNDVVLQNSRHVFDSSIWQLLWPLTNGSRVIIPNRAGILDLTQTIDIIERFQITMTDFVPSIFNAMVNLLAADRSQVAKLASLRQLLIGGEEIGAQAVQRFRSFLPHVGITNTYGPTETSIGCIFHEVTEADGDSIPIGRPIDNTCVAILDEERRLVPPGTIGEIYIGGDCMGRGYLNDPEKTKAAFVDNPYPEIPGPILYRTGDLAFHRPDGLIQFIGRRDQQVKIGGVRIELSEIEAALSTHPQVREAKVVVVGEGDQKMLVGCVVSHGALTATAVKQHLGQSLPKSSIPKQILFLEKMPLTPNGKADRKALARLAATREAPTAQDGSLSPEERAIKAIWLDLLKCGDVDIDSDFFSSGGDSLMALNLSLAIAREFKVKVPLREIVSAPTIRRLAALATGGAGSAVAQVDAAALQADADLPPEIVALPGFERGAPRNVLLTGATGFIGAQLLHDLLTFTEAQVLCLVRGQDEGAARARLRQNLQHYGLWEERFGPRLVPVVGDLGKPALGMSQDEFGRIAKLADTIVHNGAMVNLLLDYGSHRGPNVAGTVEILRLACLGRPKSIHYVSTLTVFSVAGWARGKRMIEGAECHEGSMPAGGYSQSKWVAEKLLALGRARGVPVTVYRLGEVMPHSRTGIPNSRALVDAILRGCLKLGMYFDSQITMDYTPVDYVGRLIVGVIQDAKQRDDCFHVFYPRSVSLNSIFESFGRAATDWKRAPYRTFWRTLQEASAHAPGDQDLAGLLALLPEPIDEANDPGGERTAEQLVRLFTDGTLHFSPERTLKALEELGIKWAPIDERVLDAYAAHRSPLARAAPSRASRA